MVKKKEHVGGGGAERGMHACVLKCFAHVQLMQVDNKASLGVCDPCTRAGLEPELRRCRRKWCLTQP